MLRYFQTQADVRSEIMAALCEFDQPASTFQIATAICSKNAVDETRNIVVLMANQEVFRMAQEGLVEAVVDHNSSIVRYRAYPLDRLANI